MKRQSGEHLTHEEVVDQLDDQTVSYDASLGISGRFAETLRVTIRVEVAKYELAVAWLKDLLYGSEFVKERCVFPSSRSSAVLTTTDKASNHRGPDAAGASRAQTGWEHRPVVRFVRVVICGQLHNSSQRGPYSV